MNLRRELIREPWKLRDMVASKALIHDGEDKGDGWKAMIRNDGSKERKGKVTLENSNNGYE